LVVKRIKASISQSPEIAFEALEDREDGGSDLRSQGALFIVRALAESLRWDTSVKWSGLFDKTNGVGKEHLFGDPSLIDAVVRLPVEDDESMVRDVRPSWKNLLVVFEELPINCQLG
jgi:hypothetical protein